MYGNDEYWYDSNHARYRRIEPTDGDVEPTYEEVGLMEDANIADMCWTHRMNNNDLTTNLGRQSMRLPSSPRVHVNVD